ncbi:MAG: hypothetical protein ACPG4T_01090 [Nannocystaceae bacterium]
MTAKPRPPSLSDRLGVALVTASLMMTELLLTRIFSVTIWYHFALLAISVALFGTGIAAAWVYLRQQRIAADNTGRWLAGCSLALALSIAVVDLMLVRLAPDWFSGMFGLFTVVTLRLGLLFVVTAVPFFLGGVVVALALVRNSLYVHHIYAWDLAGAGVGCLLVIPALAVFGGPLALWSAAGLACLAAGLFTRQVAGQSRLRWVGLALATAGLLAGVGVVGQAQGLFALRKAKGIDLERFAPEFSRWNAFSMVSVLPDHGFVGWGTSPKFRGPVPEQKTLVIDMNATTTLTRFTGDFAAVPHLRFDLTGFVYRLRPVSERVAVLGAGGGKDVLTALQAGARHVSAVEINPLIVENVMRGAYRDYTGNLYGRPDVRVVNSDGRTFIEQSEQAFDIVQISMVDTSAATAAGAYALAENSLYTQEATTALVGGLRPQGMLSLSARSFPGLALGARLVSLARAGLRAHGEDPSQSIMVLRTVDGLYNILAQRGPFAPALVEATRQQALALGFVPVYLPGVDPSLLGHGRLDEDLWIEGMLEPGQTPQGVAELQASWPLDVSAPTDNRPFFFYQNRARDLWAMLGHDDPHLLGNGLSVLLRVLIIALVGAGLMVLVPGWLTRPSASKHLPREKAPTTFSWFLGYAACLGIGFLFVEIALIQRLNLYLGNPTASLVVVLAVLLLGGGLGSRFLAGRRMPRRALRWSLGLTLAYLVLVLQSGIMPWLFDATRAFGLGQRAMVAAALVAPGAVVLGSALPAGMRALAERGPAQLPWFWAVNGAMSVLGTVLATLVAIHSGFDAAGWVAVVAYAMALACVPAMTSTPE